MKAAAAGYSDYGVMLKTRRGWQWLWSQLEVSSDLAAHPGLNGVKHKNNIIFLRTLFRKGDGSSRQK